MHREISSDHAAVLHVLVAPQIAGRAGAYINGDEIDFAGLGAEAETMSGGEALLVHIARDLWTADRTVGLVDVARRLDASGFARVVQALTIARGSYPRDLVVPEASEDDLAA